jgi:hypothetical protein
MNNEQILAWQNDSGDELMLSVEQAEKLVSLQVGIELAHNLEMDASELEAFIASIN